MHIKRSKREINSYKMSRVRSTNTSIENALSIALCREGARGYRRNMKGVFGTPDFCWKGRRIAVFCDSKFWHGYRWNEAKKDINVRKKFWFDKIETNIARDNKVNRRLRNDGWKVLRFWDFQIKQDPQRCTKKIALALNLGKNN